MSYKFPCSETQFSCWECPLDTLDDGAERTVMAMAVESVVIIAREDDVREEAEVTALVDAAVATRHLQERQQVLRDAAGYILDRLCSVRKAGRSPYEIQLRRNK